MVPQSKPPKGVSFKEETDARAVCQKFKEHLEAVIGPPLTEMLRRNGLPAVEIRDSDVLTKLGEIQSSVAKGNALTPNNIEFITLYVIKDPSGTLNANNSDLSKAVRKYTSLSLVLEAKTDHEFKVSYIERFLKSVGKDNDSATRNFMKKMSDGLGLVMHGAARLTTFSQSSKKPSNDEMMEKPKLSGPPVNCLSFPRERK